MKKTLMFLMALGMSAVFTACGGGSNGATDENQTTPTETTETTTPTATQTCSITQGTPLTDTRLTVHVVCDNIQAGDTVNVTVDGNVKPADITGTTVNDFLGFANLNASTRYTATVELNGQTMDTVNITTKATPVVVTPTNTAPTGQDLTINAAGAGTISGDIVISDAEDAVSALTVTVVTPPAHGTIVWNTKTNFTYTVTPVSPGYNGDDSFTYNVTDSQGLTSSPDNNVTILSIIDL